MSEIIVIPPKKDLGIKFLNVCAYARVSCGKDAMMHSLSAQISYYQTYIQQKPSRSWNGGLTTVVT